MGNSQQIKNGSALCLLTHICDVGETKQLADRSGPLFVCFQCSQSVFAARSMIVACFITPSLYLSLSLSPSVCVYMCSLPGARTGMSRHSRYSSLQTVKWNNCVLSGE